MSDIKALPDNLEELEKDIEFKKTYKKYTADELELKLIESNVEFLTIDNKSALVWRLLDSKGYTFGATGTNDAKTQDVTEPTNPATSDADGTTSGDAGADIGIDGDNSAVTLDEPVSEPTNNAEQGDTDAANDLPSTPSVETLPNSDDADNSDDLPASVETEGEPTAEPAVDATVETEPVTEPLYEPTYEPTVEADVAIEVLDEPLDELVIEAVPTIDVEPEPQPVVVIADYVDVENTGDFNMLEPATSTLIVAGTTTRVRIKGYATKDQVLRNIEQYNYNRGNKLAVISF